MQGVPCHMASSEARRLSRRCQPHLEKCPLTSSLRARAMAPCGSPMRRARMSFPSGGPGPPAQHSHWCQSSSRGQPVPQGMWSAAVSTEDPRCHPGVAITGQRPRCSPLWNPVWNQRHRTAGTFPALRYTAALPAGVSSTAFTKKGSARKLFASRTSRGAGEPWRAREGGRRHRGGKRPGCRSERKV